MPTALIEVRMQYTPAEEIAIIDAVHAALQQTLQLPDWDRTVRLLVHAPQRFACPPGKLQPARYTLIGIDMFAGRALPVKRALYAALVENLEACGIPRDHVVISLKEIVPENWGIQGGQPASEVEIGYKIDI